MATGVFADYLSCYYGEVGPLFLTNFTDDGNTQDLAKYRFPHTDGQSVEPMGRAPIVVNGEMVFYNSIDKKLYPARFIDLKKLIAAREGQFFIHPEQGQIFGYITKFSVSHEAQERNGCKASFTFEEVNTDVAAVPKDLFPTDALTVAVQAAAVADAGLTAIGVKTPAGSGSFSHQVSVFSDFLDQDRLSSGELYSTLNRFRAVINTVIGAKELADPRNYEVYRAVRELSCSITDAAQAAQINAINIIEYTLEFPTTAAELAILYYQDSRRASEIVDLNPCRYFFYPPGTKIRISDQ